MVLKNFTIGQMRSHVVFKLNTPTTAATSNREAITTGGQNDVYATLLTTRGRLRKNSGNRGLDFGLIASEDSYELICRFQSGIAAELRVNQKVMVDKDTYTIQSWEVLDQISHWYRFKLNIQVGS